MKQLLWLIPALAIGVVVGVASDNIGMGIGVGIAMGALNSRRGPPPNS